MTRAAIYARVSTEDQDLEGQLRDLRRYADARGWEVGAVYSEKVTGTGKVGRSEYDRLIRNVADPDRDWSHVLVWALDRFSRESTFTRATQAILDLEGKDVSFHSFTEPMLDTPEDGKPNLGRDVLLALLPVIAAYESKRRSERVLVAMREIKAGRRPTRSGRPPGRQPRVTQDQATMVVRMRDAGTPYSTIAQRVRLPVGTCRMVDSVTRRGKRAFITAPVTYVPSTVT